jgi:hypothetical protein
MLGSRQDKVLRNLARGVTVGSGMYILITIHPHRYFTRAQGGGAGYPITVEIIYEEDGSSDLREWIATPLYEDSALEKGKEIGRYLCDEIGLSRDVVKLVRK